MRKLLSIIIVLLFAVSSFAQLPINVTSFKTAGGGGGGSVAFRAASRLDNAIAVDATITKPTGTIDNDIIIVVFYLIIGTAVTPPAGWTEYSGSPFASWTGASRQVRAYWKRAASEGADWTWTHLNAGRYGAAFSFSGAVASGDPNDVTITSLANDDVTAHVATGVTIATANSLGVILWTNSVGSGAITNASGWTDNGYPDDLFGCINKTLGTGATGNITTTFTNTDDSIFLFTALKP